MSKTSLIGKITNLIYPIDCLGCGSEGEWLCADCLRAHRRIRLEVCALCGKAAETGICQPCQEETGLDGIISLLPYQSLAARTLIHRAKYDGYHHALSFICQAYRLKIARVLPDGFEQVAYVPSDKAKLRQRGFNPAQLIAKEMAEAALEIVDIFEKIKATESQTKLSRSKRAKNVLRAFKLKTRDLPERIIIADDVITTGATLRELVKLLRRRGTKAVWAITICHG